MILVGAQGIGKSATGRALISKPDWQGELSSDVDLLVKEQTHMQMSWINELKEVVSTLMHLFEKVFSIVALLRKR